MPPPNSQTSHTPSSAVSQDIESPTASRRSSASSTSSAPLGQPDNNPVTTDLGWQYATIHKLDSLGYRDTPTPNVAVCGEQSVGKSNLLSWLFDGKVCFYSGSGTATHGPTQVLSRRTPEQFKAEIFIEFKEPAPGVAKRVKFTNRPLTSGHGIAHILKLAGDEARRSGDGYLSIRTLDELNNQSQEHGRDTWPQFTRNVVVLQLEGHDVPNLSIIDLPGLTEDAITQGKSAHDKELAKTYLSRPETFILLCLAAGGSDRMGIAAQLVQKCDPDGRRTIGIITKADKIDAPEEDYWGKVIADELPDDVFRPSLGYWPLRLALPKERNGDATQPQLEARLRAMFEQDGWRDLASRCGRSFGWRPIHEAIFERFLSIARANRPLLVRYIGEKLAVHETALAELPGELEDPEEHLHRTIGAIVRKLQLEFSKKKYTARLLDVFIECQKALCSSVPDLRPFDRADEDQMDFPQVQLEHQSCGWDTADLVRPKIYVDDVVEQMEEFQNPLFLRRMDDTAMHPVEANMIQDHLKSWETTLLEAKPHIGKIVADMTEEIVTAACEGMERARDVFIVALEAEQGQLTSRLTSLVKQWCAREKSMPLEVEASPGHKSSRIDPASERCMKFYVEQYGRDLNQPSSSRVDRQPKKVQDGLRAIRFAIYVTVHLWDAALRVTDLFRREVQCAIKEYLNNVGRTLRASMKCANDTTRKRARELCEPDEQTCRLRDGHKDKRSRLLAIRDEMRS